MTTPEATRARIDLRAARRADGKALHRFVRASEGLETNTRYAYLLLATHFGETCVVAEREGEIVGCVLGYLIPSRPDTYFVWQVGVSPKARRTGLGRRLLRHVLDLPACSQVRHIEATVAVDNAASARLFEALARDLDTACRRSRERGFTAADFGEEDHEDEVLFRIGPWENPS